jgi:hypothetical protein
MVIKKKILTKIKQPYLFMNGPAKLKSISEIGFYSHTQLHPWGIYLSKSN